MNLLLLLLCVPTIMDYVGGSFKIVKIEWNLVIVDDRSDQEKHIWLDTLVPSRRRMSLNMKPLSFDWGLN